MTKKDANMENMTKEYVGSAIRKFRAANNLSQQQLANKLGISNMQIMRWENGHTMPNLLAMRALRELKILPPPYC